MLQNELYTIEVWRGCDLLCLCNSQSDADILLKAVEFYQDFKKALAIKGLPYALRKVEGAYIMEELKKCHGNKTVVANKLHMSRASVGEKVNQIQSLALL